MKIILILIGVWAMYIGDVNQDKIIDIKDCALIDNDVLNYAQGYLSTDLNGDDFCDINDMVFCEKNSYNFVQVIKP